jgi:uncharacterized membrane protein YccF (DUF307 family)
MNTVQSAPVVIRQSSGPHLLVRALYFVLFGLWFSGIWAAIAWIFSVTIIGLPVGLWMLNRLPQVTTLKPHTQDVLISSTGRVIERELPQHPFLLRAIYFVLIGWWFSAVWMTIAWALCASIIGSIVGFWMFDRVPAVVSLARQ